MEVRYELFVDAKKAFLKNKNTNSLDYEVICISEKDELIKVKAINFIDTIRMYIPSIENFDSNTMKNILPECYL